MLKVGLKINGTVRERFIVPNNKLDDFLDEVKSIDLKCTVEDILPYRGAILAIVSVAMPCQGKELYLNHLLTKQEEFNKKGKR